MITRLLLTALLILISCHIAIAIPCIESDYKQYFSECDRKESTRTVTVYQSSQCDSLPSKDNPVLSIYSRLPTFTIPCSTECSSGEHVTFDVLKNETVCSKCPEDTYSQGGDFKMSVNWNQETIRKHFFINCYAIDSFSFKKNEDCSRFNVLNDRSMMTSGELTGQQLKYLFEMIYFFKSKNNGRLVLKYKKDTTKEHGFNNGDLKIFLDYELIGGDNNPDESLHTVYRDFAPGEHEMVIFYNYYKMGPKALKLFIQSIEVIGLDDASYHCEKCVDSISPIGSEQCITCKDNHIFDKALQECRECPADEFAVSSSVYTNTCRKRKECGEFDYQLLKADQCLNDKRSIELILIKPSYCLLNKTSDGIKKEVKCVSKAEAPLKELKCSEGKGLVNYYQMDFSQGKIEENVKFNYGWYSNGLKLFVGAYSSEANEKVLKFEAKRNSSFASTQLSLDIKLSSNEFFKVKVNQELVKDYSNVSRTETIEVPLNEVNNNVELVYQKISSELTMDNPVTVTSIELIGTDLMTKQMCSQCPLDSISLLNSNNCVKCKETEIPNSQQTECVPCPNGIRQSIDGVITCSNCPSFTSFNGHKCVLNEIIHQSEEKLKFNLAPMKEWLHKLCTDQSGILCYENAFIGPINSKASSSSIANDIFFISLFEPKAIEVYDFDYDDNSNALKEGHIFGLFSVNKPILGNSDNSSDLFIDHNITYQNTKTKKNIAKAIEAVHLLGKSINSSKRLGAIIEYEQGDTCLSDPARKYKAYVYLKCEKHQISAPRMIRATDSNCLFIFEWGSPYLCKNCLTKEVSAFERGTCKNNQRQIIFSSNDECLIFNGTNPALLGFNKDYSELLLNETHRAFQLVFNAKDNKRDLSIVTVDEGDSVSFPFEYIENRTYYQQCTFMDNLESSWKKYLLIIPIVYLITCLLVICYCCKYRKIKNDYERLKASDISHQDIVKEKEELGKGKSIEKKLEISSS